MAYESSCPLLIATPCIFFASTHFSPLPFEMNGSGRDWLLVLAANRKTASSKRVHGLIFISKEKGLGAKLLLCTNLVVCEHHVDGEKQFQDTIAIFFSFPLGCCWGNTLPQSSSKSEEEWNSGMERVESRLADLICSLSLQC